MDRLLPHAQWVQDVSSVLCSTVVFLLSGCSINANQQHRLRQYQTLSAFNTGCTLPVEMFFPEEEVPTPTVELELEQLGVLCSVLPDLVPAYALQNGSNTLNDTEGKRLAGFSMKSAAILLSSFEEVCSALLLSS